MTIYAIVKTTVTAHENGVGNLPDGSVSVTSVEDLEQLQMKQLVELFNITSPLKKIKRFSSKKQAQTKVWERLPELATHTRGDTLVELYVAQFAGRRIHILAKKNPRQSHTHGHMIWEKQLKDGMSFEQYTRVGGRIHDLLIDIRMERLELK